MRIRMFEGFSDPLYYELATETDDEYEKFRDLYYKTRGEVVPEKVMNKISNLLKSGLVCFYRTETIVPFSSTGEHLCIKRERKHPLRVSDWVDKFEIFQLPDDWFFVVDRIFQRPRSSNKYYKCDNLEGVVQLLKDRKLYMKRIKLFVESFESDIESENVYKNIVDDIYDNIEDRFPTLPFRVVLYRRPGSFGRMTGYDYIAYILLKVVEKRVWDYDKKIYDIIDGFISKSRRRFRKRLDIRIQRGMGVDSYVWSRAYKNGELKSNTYNTEIIYDLKSGDYVDDIV